MGDERNNTVKQDRVKRDWGQARKQEERKGDRGGEKRLREKMR